MGMFDGMLDPYITSQRQTYKEASFVARHGIGPQGDPIWAQADAAYNKHTEPLRASRAGRFVSDALPNQRRPGDLSLMSTVTGRRFHSIEVVCSCADFAASSFQDWFSRELANRLWTEGKITIKVMSPSDPAEVTGIGRIPQDEAERHYISGCQSALRGMLAHVLRDLGYEDTEATRAKWVLERSETVAKLREMCGDLGDNDWTDNLHLVDIIDKHLWRHMETR